MNLDVFSVRTVTAKHTHDTYVQGKSKETHGDVPSLAVVLQT